MADNTHASGQSGQPSPSPILERTTLPQSLLEIAEHLKDSGEFNERAYLAMCDAAKQANDIRDIVIENLVREVDNAKQTMEQGIEEHAEATRILHKANKEIDEANRRYAASAKQYREATELVNFATTQHSSATIDMQRCSRILDQINLLVQKYKKVKGLGKEIRSICKKGSKRWPSSKVQRRSLRLALK